MEIIFSDERNPETSILELINRAGELCVLETGLCGDRLEVSVTFVGMDEIHALNRRFRANDSVTDVISFPQYSSLSDIPKDERVSLGDVVICPEQARLQAEDFGHSLKRELVFLFVHGVLHLLAFDHESEEDKYIMRKTEEKIMSELDLKREQLT